MPSVRMLQIWAGSIPVCAAIVRRVPSADQSGDAYESDAIGGPMRFVRPVGDATSSREPAAIASREPSGDHQ